MFTHLNQLDATNLAVLPELRKSQEQPVFNPV